MVWKKMFEKSYMFKMCFKAHRIQKLYLKINFFFQPQRKFGGVELSNFFDGPKKLLIISTPRIFIVDEKKKFIFKYIFWILWVLKHILGI